MTENKIKGQVNMFDPDIWSGKMSPEPSVQTKARTSAASSKKQPGSSSRLPLYLDLRRASGQQQVPSWETGGPLPGEYTTPSFGESPKDAAESVLSQILEEEAPPKYYLSARACQGILNRAEKRGKQIPDILREALENQANDREISDPQD